MVQVAGGHTETDVVDARVAPVRRFSWGALFSGIVMVLVTQLLLTLLGIAVGLGTLDAGSADLRGMGTGAALWWLGSWIVSVFLGGWVAGRLAGNSRRLDGALHGLVTWGATTLAIFWLVTSTLGAVIGGSFGVLGSVATSAVQTTAPSAAELESVPAQVEAAAPAVGRELAGAAQASADEIATASLWSALALALGALAGIAGGALGTPRDVVVHRIRRREYRT